MLSFLKEPLEDLCISRPKSRLTWGIPLPFDDNYVTYVWFDALINYLAGLGYPDGPLFSKFWPVVEHVIAKDILKPHGIYWPIMLQAAGIAPYRHLNVHGYWNLDQSKISKSIGNVVRPLDLVDITALMPSGISSSGTWYSGWIPSSAKRPWWPGSMPIWPMTWGIW